MPRWLHTVAAFAGPTYPSAMASEHLFELGRRTFDTPEFRGITCIEVEARSIINRVPGTSMPFDWSISPYRGCTHACVYCFARPTHTCLDMDAGRDFETKIVVKVNAAEVLGRELSARRWTGAHIAMGTPTDTIGPSGKGAIGERSWNARRS